MHRRRGVPSGASIASYAALPLNYLAKIITQLDVEHRIALTDRSFTSRLEMNGGRLLFHLRLDLLILNAAANEGLLRAIFPQTPLRMERPVIAGGARVVQVITRDWAKFTLHSERRTRWYDEVASRIRPDRPTLVVYTQACEADLRTNLAGDALEMALAKRKLAAGLIHHSDRRVQYASGEYQALLAKTWMCLQYDS